MTTQQVSLRIAFFFTSVVAATFAVAITILQQPASHHLTDAFDTQRELSSAGQLPPPPPPAVVHATNHNFEQQELLARIAKSKLELVEREARSRKEKDEQEAAKRKAKAEREAKVLAAKLERDRSAAKDAEKVRITERDILLRKECLTFAKPPRTLRLHVGNGVLEVSCPLNTLYMLTGGFDNDGVYFSSLPGEETPWYPAGGSSLHISVSFSAGGHFALPIDGWLNVNGKAEKLSITSSNQAVLEDRHSSGIFSPKSPGTCDVKVSLADKSISIPVLVVPLDFAGNESTDALVAKHGLPNNVLDVSVLWPNSKTVHGVHYYDNLKGTSLTMGHHWKYNRFPGAVVVTAGRKIFSIGSTSLDFAWPRVR